MTYCPACTSYQVECSVDPQDFEEACKYFKARIQTCRDCGETYDIDVGCLYCEMESESHE